MSMRIIFHIDVNNAYLSWHSIDALKKGSTIDYRTIPAIVGGDEEARHGIVLAKSFPAKEKGVVTAEPIFQAKRKCPGLKILKPLPHVYKHYSDLMFALIRSYTPDIEIMSVDECYLDYTKVKKLYGDPIKFAHKLKDEIKDRLGFTVNIGIANTKVCAKMASDFKKPDRVHTLFQEEIQEKMWPLPIEKLYMTGKKSVIKLKEMGIHTIGDLANFPLDRLKRIFKSKATLMYEFAWGIDEREVNSVREQYKCISQEITLPRDYEKVKELEELLKNLAYNIAYRLRENNFYAYVVEVHLKNHQFKSFSHQIKLKNPINTTADIYKNAVRLLHEMYHDDKIRLIGIRVNDFTERQTVQYSLFDQVETSKKEEKVERIMDEINRKYGTQSISYATQKKIDK